MNDLIEREDVIRVVNAYDDTAYALQDVQRITDGIVKVIKSLPSARPKEERMIIGAVCVLICRHCIKANGDCQYRWNCPLLTEIAELIEPRVETQTERAGDE